MTRSRPWRRWKDYTKARRKYELDKELNYQFTNRETGALEQHLFYRHFHEYSKGKIHCSCPLCSSYAGGETVWLSGALLFSRASGHHMPRSSWYCCRTCPGWRGLQLSEPSG